MTTAEPSVILADAELTGDADEERPGAVGRDPEPEGEYATVQDGKGLFPGLAAQRGLGDSHQPKA